MSIGMQFGVDFLCARMPNQHRQTARQKSHSWKRHKNAPVRCPYSNSPIAWSHRNQCNWSPWKKDVRERQSSVVGVALWTFVHITRAGSIHRAEQKVDAWDPVQQKSKHDGLLTKHCSYARRLPLRLCVCAGKSRAAGNFTTEAPSLHPTTPSNAPGFSCLPPRPASGPCRGPFY
jgi:hypothetical protein